MRERVLINLMVYNDMGELLGIVQTMIAKVKGIERRLTRKVLTFAYLLEVEKLNYICSINSCLSIF